MLFWELLTKLSQANCCKQHKEKQTTYIKNITEHILSPNKNMYTSPNKKSSKLKFHKINQFL